MKTFLRTSVIAAALALASAVPVSEAQAQSKKPVYSKTSQNAIGITVSNATGASYTIRDQKGNVVLQGRVKSDKPFFIPTAKLAKGAYRFFIGNYAAQEFIIK